MAKNKTIQWYQRQISKSINNDNRAIFIGYLAKNLNSKNGQALYEIALWYFDQDCRVVRALRDTGNDRLIA